MMENMASTIFSTLDESGDGVLGARITPSSTCHECRNARPRVTPPARDRPHPSTCEPACPRATGLDELEHGLHSSPDFLKLISSTGNKPLTAAALLEEMDTQACRAPPDAAPRRSAAHARVASGCQHQHPLSRSTTATCHSTSSSRTARHAATTNPRPTASPTGPPRRGAAPSTCHFSASRMWTRRSRATSRSDARCALARTISSAPRRRRGARWTASPRGKITPSSSFRRPGSAP